MRLYKSSFVIVLSLILLTSIKLNAQTEEKDNSLEAGKWALQFQINNNFTLSSFQGAIISAKYHFADSKAIRFGIGGNYSFNEVNTGNSQDTAFSYYGKENDTRNYSISIYTQYLSYVNPDKEVLLFWGIGPIIQYEKSTLNQTSQDSNSYISTKSDVAYNSHIWGFGATAVLGVEWFAGKSFSLHAEYGTILLYNWGENIQNTTNQSSQYREINVNSSQNNRRWGFGPSSVKFGLSVYF
jgi:hypothetical protein